MAAASAPADIINHDSAPPSNPYATPSAAMPLVSPHALLYTSLSQDPPIRCSSRLCSQCRPISINTSSLTHANGSTLIKIGQTTAVCGVRAEILPIHEIANFRVNKNLSSQPSSADEDEDSPKSDAIIRNHNLLVPNLELSTGCSPFHLPGSPPSQEAQSLSQRLLSLLHTSRLVRPSDLCIYDESITDLEQQLSETDAPPEKKLKAFWTLYIDTVIINHDGNLFDTCALAMFSALKDTLLPKAWWDADLESVTCSPELSKARRLRLRGCPVPLSFSVFRSHKLEEDGGKAGKTTEEVLYDPDAFEEGCCAERGCVIVDLDRKGGFVVVKIEKYGGGVLGREGLRQLVEKAGDRWKEWQQVLIKEAGSKKSAG
jgi:exosome complex component RRP43